MAIAIAFSNAIIVNAHNTSDDPQQFRIIPGDVNGDRVVNVSDLVVLHAYFKGLKTLDDRALVRADCNYDGVVNETDLILLTNRVKGK